MYKLLLLLGVCVIPLISAGDSKCGPLNILKVKRQWHLAYGTGNHRLEFAQALWKAIIAKEPKIRDFLKSKSPNGDNVQSAEFKAHASRSVGNLDIFIGLLDDEATFKAQAAFFKQIVQKRGIPEPFFKVFADTLLEVIPAQIQGHCYDQDAWEACRGQLADALKGDA